LAVLITANLAAIVGSYNHQYQVAWQHLHALTTLALESDDLNLYNMPERIECIRKLRDVMRPLYFREDGIRK